MCAVYILYSKISTDPGLLKMRHSHQFTAVVIQFLFLLLCCTILGNDLKIKIGYDNLTFKQ